MQTDFLTSLGLSSLFSLRLGEKGITHPTEIQKKAIPKILSGESFFFQSATGTGKTFAYLLPLLERLIALLGEGGSIRGRPLLLIAAPTFELCSQIKNEADFLLKEIPVHTGLLIGSAAPVRQIEALKRDRPEVIVGNPGRILSLARQRKLKLRSVRYLVLDEGDRLVQDELFEETREMVSLLRTQLKSGPPDAPPLLAVSCSATLPAKCRKRLLPLLELDQSPTGGTEGLEGTEKTKHLKADFYADDSNLEVLREKVQHWAIFSQEREKANTLRSLIAALEALGAKGRKKKPSVKALIFIGRASQVENIASRLKHSKLPAAALSGAMDSKLRREALDGFRSGRIRFLVSSDLAARGLDIADVSHVIALDVNEDKDVYLHRAGRTARAGKTGVMISIGTEGEMHRLAALEKNLGLTVYPKELYGGRIMAPEPTLDET